MNRLNDTHGSVDIGNAKRGKGWKLKKQAWIEKIGKLVKNGRRRKNSKKSKKISKKGLQLSEK